MSSYAVTSKAPQPELSKLSRDLNNSLGIIVGECEVLRYLLLSEPKALQRVTVILQAAHRMADNLRARCPHP